MYYAFPLDFSLSRAKLGLPRQSYLYLELRVKGVVDCMVSVLALWKQLCLTPKKAFFYPLRILLSC